MKIEIELSDFEVALLNSDLIDIQEWVRNAVQGKINWCKKRLIREYMDVLYNDPGVDSIPADMDKLAEVIMAHPQYKDAVTKLKEQEEELQRRIKEVQEKMQKEQETEG